jgi:hypothetical protein
MTGSNGPTPPDANSSKRVRLCTIFVKIFQPSAATSSRLAPFPIRINNLMPAITVDLGHSLDAAVSLVCLYDTCIAVCSGNLLFHQWVITTYPDFTTSVRATLALAGFSLAIIIVTLTRATLAFAGFTLAIIIIAAFLYSRQSNI